MRRYIIFILLALCAVAHAQTDRQYIREGNRLYRQKDFANSEVAYRKAISKNPENPQASYNLACALMMQQKDSAAIVQYQNAARLEKNKMRQAKVYHNIGVICQNHKMYDDAIKAYEQSLRCNPGDDETRYNLALCKKLRKQQPKDNQQKDDKNKDKDNNGKDEKKEKDKDKDKQQQQQEQMSKDNAEQLLNAAIQNEKTTQQRLKKAMQQPRSRNIQKNW